MLVASLEHHMNTYNPSNPFKVPSCFQRADLQQRRRNRIKKVVIGVIAAFAALMVVLLIEGCMSEHARAATTTKEFCTAVSDTPPTPIAVTVQKTSAALQTNPVASVTVAPVAAKISAPSAAQVTESIYVVKSGDTLARIAKQHKLTVKALKSVNDLDTDSIVVGMKLKLPV